MSNTLLLIKNYFNSFLGNLSKRKGNAAKYGTGLVMLLLMGLVSLYLFISLAISSVEESIKAGYPESSLYVTSSMALVFILLMTITKSSSPTKHKDDEILLSFPISKKSIVIAKVFYDYIFDLLIVGMTLLPSLIVYYVKVPSTSIMLILRGIVLIILLPMFSNALGYLIGLLFNFLTRKFRHFSIIQSLITIIAMLIFLIIYYGITVISTTDSLKGTEIIYSIKPLRWMVEFISVCDISSLMIIALISVIPFIISIILKSMLLGKTINSAKITNHIIKFKQSTPLMSLYKNEVSRYFNLPVYVVNTMFGGILLIIISLTITILGTYGINIMDMLMTVGVTNIDKYYIAIIIILFEFSIATLSTTAASISLEGKNIWILKANPIAVKDIFLSKILLNMTVGIVPIILSTFIISFNIGFSYFPILLLIFIISQFIVSVMGLICNLNYPKLEWESESTPIKQSMSVGLAFVYSFLVSLIPIFCYVGLMHYLGDYALLISLLIYILIAFILFYILNKNASKKFNQIN